MDIIEKSKEFAIEAHTQIDHRRKYSKQPYSVHLAAVVRRVTAVTDDAATIATAWLHDVVEDTPATLYDVEQTFGAQIAQMVSELTDVSKPSDGNRAARKKLDCEHLAKASPAAQTVKLADLIDNCLDICKNDARFAQVYLQEMQALLQVLTSGNAELIKQANKTYHQCCEKLADKPLIPAPDNDTPPWPMRKESGSHLIRVFSDAFIAQDIAAPLHSFDADKPCKAVCKQMQQQQLEIICLRKHGLIRGYARQRELTEGQCANHLREFRQGQIIPGDATLSDVIHVLTLHQYGFITTLGEVSGYFSRADMNKPVVRVWLFGIITFIEMELMSLIQARYPNESWRSVLSEGRLEKALAMQDERQRRNQHCPLLECLQFSDKGQILIQNDTILQQLGFDSRKNAKRLVKELESLRNNLAHAQDIVTYDWAPIARLSYRLEATLTIRRNNVDDEMGPA